MSYRFATMEQNHMEQNHPEMVLDFISDYAEHIQQYFKALGVATAATAPYELIVRYTSLARRLIPTKARGIGFSREFQCPPQSKSGLALLKHRILRGEPLVPHMSTQIFDADFNDGMFNDWGVHHLHLGLVPYRKNARFVERTGPVLYAMVTPSTVYAIDVMTHGKGHKHAWTSQRIIQIVYDNWPMLLKRGLHTDLAGGDALTDDEYEQARQGNVTAALVLRDGTPLIGPGGGISTNGTGIRAVIEAHGKLEALGQFEENVRQAAPEIVQNLKQSGTPVPVRLHMKMTFVDGLPFARCEEPPFQFPLTPQGSAAVAERHGAAASK
jgi:hypothetical protein